MLVTLVACYFAVTICIGFYAARRVKNSADYLVAGRSLPLYMNTATVFATWGKRTAAAAHTIRRAVARRRTAREDWERTGRTSAHVMRHSAPSRSALMRK